MTVTRIDQQQHGYRSGHQLLASSLRLPREDQDTVDRLSDMSGPLRPGETFSPYLTMYPLPSGSHYVVARTWQDLDAPRAGCVLSRSLLVPSLRWQQLHDVTSLVLFLRPIESGEQANPLEWVQADTAMPSVDDPHTTELVEAIFLENRLPITVFDVPESKAEAIALRLLTAIWPSLRRSFAICTFALASRKIGGREFDLMFAPKSARTRFSDWSGRRIDFAGSYSARHRWSPALTTLIFHSDHPSLIAQDALGVLKDDTRGDESVLRLSLLWNELSEKAPTTPSAVLGLLDILNSQRDNSETRFESLFPQVARALDRAIHEFPDAQAWRFLTTLVRKFPNEAAPQRISIEIEKSAKVLACRKPQTAFEFLIEESKGPQRMPSAILVGLADGTSSSPDVVTSEFKEIAPELGLQLISLSKAFAHTVLNIAKHSPSDWIAALVQALEGADGELRRKVRAQVAPQLDDAGQAPLLRPLLEGVTPTELVDIVVTVGRTTGFAVTAFDEPLGNAARDDNGLLSLRNAIVSQFEGSEADRFLLSTMRADAQDSTWLCTQVPVDRACNLLARLLESASDRALVTAQRDSDVRRLIFDTLSNDLSVGAKQAARILSLSDMPIEAFLENGERVLPYLAPPEGNKLADHLLARALSEAAPRDGRVVRLVENIDGRAATRDLVRWATPQTASPTRIAENLLILDSAPPNVRFHVISRVDELSDRLVRRGQANLGRDAYDAWARLIGSGPDEETRFRAASPSLTFALHQPRLPVSSLIVVSFPIVYAQLLRSKEEDERTVPAFLALPMSFFLDWDRANSARRDLVDSYLNSTWPPADLLATAVETGIANDTLDRLSRTNPGREYIRAIEGDLARLDGPTQRRAFESLKQFFF
jgi:hypothetical protein